VWCSSLKKLLFKPPPRPPQFHFHAPPLSMPSVISSELNASGVRSRRSRQPCYLPALLPTDFSLCSIAEPRRIVDTIRTLTSFTFNLILQVCFPRLVPLRPHSCTRGTNHFSHSCSLFSARTHTQEHSVGSFCC
jgi:hypothetical protein